jgi:hypothetical protein
MLTDTTISREMLTTARGVVRRHHRGAAHRPSSGDRPALVSPGVFIKLLECHARQ